MTGKKGKQGYGGGQQIEHTDKVKDDKQTTKKSKEKDKKKQTIELIRCQALMPSLVLLVRRTIYAESWSNPRSPQLFRTMDELPP